MATLNDMSTWAVHTRGGLREFFTKEGKHCVEQNRAENGRRGSWPVKAMTGRASFDGLIPEKATPCKWTRVGLPDKDRRRASPFRRPVWYNLDYALTILAQSTNWVPNSPIAWLDEYLRSVAAVGGATSCHWSLLVSY